MMRTIVWSRWATAALTLGVFLTGRPASAQIDLSGQWGNRVQEDQPWRGPGQEIGEFTGLPINAEARAKAESWTASIYTIPERQ